jgi:toxin ParE1/3/4
MLPLVRTPQAARDLNEIVLYIAERDPAAALRVLDYVEQTLALICRSPHIGSRVVSADQEVEGFRVITVKRYRRYLIYFRPKPDCVEIARIVHGHRDQEELLTS